MAYISGRVLDGYQTPVSDNSFVSPWIDCHSAPYLNIKSTFTGSDGYRVAGTLTLEESDDRPDKWTDGQTYPASARFNGGIFGNPTDLTTYSGSSITVSGNTAPSTYSLPGTATARFFRVRFVASSSFSHVLATVTFSFKTSS